MHVLAHQHYLREIKQKRGKKPQPAWLTRLKTTPAHWSAPAKDYQESLTRLNNDVSFVIREAPMEEKVRIALSAMHSMILQVLRMVDSGNIRDMVRNEFWSKRCYGDVTISIEDAVKITNRLVDELGDRELRILVNDAVAPKEGRREVA